VTGVLTFEGQRAARDHREAVAKTLLDAAATAAERYADFTNTTVNMVVGSLLGGVSELDPLDLARVEFPTLQFHGDFAKQCSCEPRRFITDQFAYDFASDSLVLKTGNLNAKDHTLLVSLLKTHDIDRMRQGWLMALVTRTTLSSGEIVGFAVRPQWTKASNLPERQYAYGFLAKPGFLQTMLWPADSLNAKMPSSDKNKSVVRKRFALAVSAGDKVILNDGKWSQFSADWKTLEAYGGLNVRVGIDPAAVPALSGVPVSPLRDSTLFGLLVLACILIGAALILAKRQSELAAAREDFVSSVSHELRTPLAQIRMFTETLLLGRVRNEVERRRSLEIIDQETRRLSALVENVLHLSRAERGTARVTPSTIELAPTVREVVETFAQLPRSRSADFRLELENRLVATVDPNALRQILLNLLDNAVKYGKANQRVSVGLAMFEEHARIWVDDEGPGIPGRERERIFEPFYRGAAHTDSSLAGSGIGLAVVRELAGLLGGRAWADDAPGGGARVVVEFPDAYLRAEEASGSIAVA
jgi:signal transduction histidine kinase